VLSLLTYKATTVTFIILINIRYCTFTKYTVQGNKMLSKFWKMMNIMMLQLKLEKIQT